MRAARQTWAFTARGHARGAGSRRSRPATDFSPTGERFGPRAARVPAVRQLSEVIDFEVLLARDAELAEREGPAALLVRDRALAEQFEVIEPRPRLRRWLAHRSRLETELPGDRARGLVVLFTWILGLLGVVSGAAAAAALLAYDGRTPVNVLAWLLYLAAVPFGLALLLGLGLVIPSRWLPRAGAAQALVAAVLEPLLRRLPHGRQWARALFGRSSGEAAALQRWLFVGLTQLFTLGFLGAALVTLLVEVSINDLTFAWRTTLPLGDDRVTQLVGWVGSPWQAFLPDAVPDAAAVAESNYRRFVDRFRDTDTRSPVDVAIGASWWMWSAMAVLVYGVLPRIAFLVLAGWRYRRALAAWPALDRPDVATLLARFEDTGGAFSARRLRDGPPLNGVAAEAPPETEATEAPPLADPAESASGLAVAWGAAAAEPESAARALDDIPETVLGAGTDLDLAAERAVLSAAAARGGPVTVLMPLSEPPIEDVLGFLRELRSVAPQVTLVSVDRVDEGWRMTTPDDAWRRALDRVRGVEAHEG